jgi:hypothetical protein
MVGVGLAVGVGVIVGVGVTVGVGVEVGVGVGVGVGLGSTMLQPFSHIFLPASSQFLPSKEDDS